MTTPDDEEGDEQDLRLHPHYEMSTEQRLMIIIERQNNVLRRVRDLEKKQSEVSSLLNKGAGAIAVVVGFGVFIGWLLAIGGNIRAWFK